MEILTREWKSMRTVRLSRGGGNCQSQPSLSEMAGVHSSEHGKRGGPRRRTSAVCGTPGNDGADSGGRLAAAGMAGSVDSGEVLTIPAGRTDCAGRTGHATPGSPSGCQGGQKRLRSSLMSDMGCEPRKKQHHPKSVAAPTGDDHVGGGAQRRGEEKEEWAQADGVAYGVG